MIAFDTNYLIRHLVQDDPEQCAQTGEIVTTESQHGRGIILYDIVLCEAMWVLASVFQANRADILAALKAIQDEPTFVFENPERISAAIKNFESGKADFADYLIMANSRERGDDLRTFDKVLKRELP